MTLSGRSVFFAGVAAAGLALTGCGGGGSSSSNVKPEEDTYVNVTPAVQQTTIEDGEDALIAVIDTEFRTSHEEFEGRIETSYNRQTGGEDVTASVDDEDGIPAYMHGTPVAALAAGNTFGVAGNGKLALFKAGSGGSVRRSYLQEGMKWSAEQDARVANLSFSGGLNALNDADTADALASSVEMEMPDGSFERLGTAIVIAAGNEGESVTDNFDMEKATDDGLLSVLDQTLIAVGSDEWEKYPASNYPGADEDLQARALAAPFVAQSASNTSDDATGTFGGTSIAAPQIAGMVATINSQWPHMSAKETTGLLLDTADQGSELFEKNDCGPDENLNCGNYYLGQGHADLEEALKPQGETAIASSGKVEDGGHALSETQATWSSSFGGSFDTAALEGVVGFDDLGRDYQLDLSSQSHPVMAYGQRLAGRVQKIATAGLNPRPITNEVAPGLSMTSHHTTGGMMGASEVRLDTGTVELAAFGFHQGETALMDPWTPENGMAMLSDGSGGLSHLLSQGAGFAATLSMTDRVAMDVGHWAGSAKRDEDSLYNGYRQARTDVAMRFDATDALELEVGYGQRHEQGGLLGSRGYGALSLGDRSTMGLMSVGANWSMGDYFGLMARYERGQADVAGGPGMIRSIDGLTTEQSALGLTFERDQHEAVFMVSQPLRVTAGTANLDVPVGRDVEGNVIREQRSASLAPNGRQQDVELGYAYAPSVDSRLNVNLLYSNNPDHQDGSDAAGVATFSKRF